MAKPKKPPSKETFIKGCLRRGSLMYRPISECRRLARRAPNQYECSLCKGLFTSKEIDVDHLRPVIDIMTGFVDWNTYIDRLFCDIEDLACLCKTCHKSKTESEVHMRKYARAKRKAEANAELDKDYNEDGE
jgi:5-methylcytosine-specific restriction endonuclease McrA